jgi:hypothetical protein
METLQFEELRCKLGSKAGSNSRIQFTSNESKLDLCPSRKGLSLKALIMDDFMP